MSAPSNQAYREAFERFLTRLGWTVERSDERRSIWVHGPHGVFIPQRVGSEFDMLMRHAVTTVREATGATFVYEVSDMFPRWQIRHKNANDGNPTWGECEWFDADEGLEPDWVWIDEDDSANPADYIAVQVSAIQTRQHPSTQGAQP